MKICYDISYSFIICVIVGFVSCTDGTYQTGPSVKSPVEITKEQSDTVKASSEQLSSDRSEPNKPDTSSTLKHKKPLKLILTNLTSENAPIVVSVYSRNNTFLDRSNKLDEYVLHPHGTTHESIISDLAYGEIALTLFQDFNGNGKFDMNTIGLPKEDYAFSNNVRPKLGAPDYNECKFSYSERTNVITIKMISK